MKADMRWPCVQNVKSIEYAMRDAETSGDTIVDAIRERRKRASSPMSQPQVGVP